MQSLRGLVFRFWWSHRLRQIDLPERYGTENPLDVGAADLNKEKGFFETNVAGYQTGGSLDR
ncbi:MAG: ribonucleoside-diphosphate reductase beta chain [Methanobacteriota archaeon]|jgi:ribonucleoside-diphosphate reductase beta chain